MKALSIKQPWVYAILHEGKNIENRSWQNKYRGWIALHASAKPLIGGELPGRKKLPDLATLDYSAICGVARLVDIVTASRSKWFWNPEDGSINYGWVLEDVTPLKKLIPCKGALGLWDMKPETLREVKRQLPKMKFED